MLDKIILTKEGILMVMEEGKKTPLTENLAMYMSHNFEVEKGTKVKALLDIIEANAKFFDIIFKSATRGYKIEKFFNTKKPVKTNTFNELVFKRIVSISEYEGDEYFEKDEYINVTAKKNNDVYGIGLEPDIKVLYDADLIIDDTYEVDKSWYPKKYSAADSKHEILFKVKTPLTLSEVLYSFLYELTFHGYPKDKLDFIDSMNNRIEDIENGDAELVNSNQLLIDWAKKDLEEVIASEEYEKAEEIKKYIIELEKKIEK